MLHRTLFAAALALAAPIAAAGSLEAVKARYNETWGGVSAFRCDVRIDAGEGGEALMSSTGNMQALRQADGEFHWRMDLTMALDIPEMPEPMEARVVTAYDGEHVTTVMDFMGQKQVQRSQNPEHSTVPIGEAMWEGLEEEATLSYLGEGEVGGVPVHLVRAVWDEDANDGSPGAAVYSFRQDNALVLRAEIEMDDNDAGTITMTASEYDLSADVDEAAFDLEIPVGARILEIE